jgi:hypothetical protein
MPRTQRPLRRLAQARAARRRRLAPPERPPALPIPEDSHEDALLDPPLDDDELGPLLDEYPDDGLSVFPD